MKNRTRKDRVRKKLKVRSTRPRLTVFVSNKHLYAQIIDDAQGKTLVAARDVEVAEKKTGGKTLEMAEKVGVILAQRAVKSGIKQVVFDRGDKKYHGRVKALADSARKEGLVF